MANDWTLNHHKKYGTIHRTVSIGVMVVAGLLLLYVDPGTAQRYYQRFKFAWVGSLPQADFGGYFDLQAVMRGVLEREADDPDYFTTKEL